MKNNFRDPCLANFGGDLFNDVADRADDIYNSMDPPTPSRADDVQNKPNAPAIPQNAQEFAQVYNNNDDDQYYGGGGGCFSGDSLIALGQNGLMKQVKDLKKGDIVKTIQGKTAQVQCVVKTYTLNNRAKMCQPPGGLKITPGHPIKHQGTWKYPRELHEPKIIECEAVYNLVLE